VCLVRVTVPVGTHPHCGMRPCLLELHLLLLLVPVCQWPPLPPGQVIPRANNVPSAPIYLEQAAILTPQPIF